MQKLFFVKFNLFRFMTILLPCLTHEIFCDKDVLKKKQDKQKPNP